MQKLYEALRLAYQLITVSLLESPITFDEIFKVTSVPFLFLILFY